jgi:hypothetical protein
MNNGHLNTGAKVNNINEHEFNDIFSIGKRYPNGLPVNLNFSSLEN